MTMYTTGERSLEKYKIFPIIAWTTFIGFAIFVYGITLQLREVSENLEQTSSHLQQFAPPVTPPATSPSDD